MFKFLTIVIIGVTAFAVAKSCIVKTSRHRCTYVQRNRGLKDAIGYFGKKLEFYVSDEQAFTSDGPYILQLDLNSTIPPWLTYIDNKCLFNGIVDSTEITSVSFNMTAQCSNCQSVTCKTWDVFTINFLPKPTGNKTAGACCSLHATSTSSLSLITVSRAQDPVSKLQIRTNLSQGPLILSTMHDNKNNLHGVTSAGSTNIAFTNSFRRKSKNVMQTDHHSFVNAFGIKTLSTVITPSTGMLPVISNGNGYSSKISNEIINHISVSDDSLSKSVILSHHFIDGIHEHTQPSALGRDSESQAISELRSPSKLTSHSVIGSIFTYKFQIHQLHPTTSALDILPSFESYTTWFNVRSITQMVDTVVQNRTETFSITSTAVLSPSQLPGNKAPESINSSPSMGTTGISPSRTLSSYNLLENYRRTNSSISSLEISVSSSHQTRATALLPDYRAPKSSGPLRLHVSAGQCIVYPIPRTAFYDDHDGDARTLWLSLSYRNRTQISESFWLWYDHEHMSIGVYPPYNAFKRLNEKLTLSLRAVDFAGFSIKTNVYITVDGTRYLSYSYLFVVKFEVQLGDVIGGKYVRSFFEYLAKLSNGSVNVYDIYLIQYDVDTIQFTLLQEGSDKCDLNISTSISNLFVVPANVEVHNYPPVFFGNRFKVINYTAIPQKICQRLEDDDHSDAAHTITIVIFCVVALVFLTTLIVVSVAMLHCRKVTGSDSGRTPSESFPSRKPVILPEDLGMMEVDYKGKKPIILNEEHGQIQPIDSGLDGDALRPPPPSYSSLQRDDHVSNDGFGGSDDQRYSDHELPQYRPLPRYIYNRAIFSET